MQKRAKCCLKNPYRPMLHSPRDDAVKSCNGFKLYVDELKEFIWLLISIKCYRFVKKYISFLIEYDVDCVYRTLLTS